MSKRDTTEVRDIEECKRKIKEILVEYNCEIQTDDWHFAWLYDKDTEETSGIGRGE